MSDEIPDPWRSAAERRGISPTYRPLAARAGVSHETVRKIVQGRATSTRSIRKLADALGVDVEVVHAWRGEAPPDYGREFIPDESSWLLTTEEREAVNTLIRLITRDRSKPNEEVGRDDRDAAPMKQAGGSPAPRPRIELITAAGSVDLGGSPRPAEEPRDAPPRRSPRRR